MEHLEGEQHCQYPMERKPNVYRSMRDYINPPWVSAPSYMVPPATTPYGNTYSHSWGNHPNSSWKSRPPQYTPSAPPYYASTPQPPQPPQLSSSVEQAILNLSKLVDTFIEERKAVNVQANQKIDTMERKIDTVESSLKKELDGFQSKIDQKFDNLQCSILRLASQQHVHKEKENPERECLIDTILGERTQLQQLQEDLIEEPVETSEELQDAPKSFVVCPWKKKEETFLMLTGEGSRRDAVEELQNHNLHLPFTD